MPRFELMNWRNLVAHVGTTPDAGSLTEQLSLVLAQFVTSGLLNEFVWANIVHPDQPRERVPDLTFCQARQRAVQTGSRLNVPVTLSFYDNDEDVFAVSDTVRVAGRLTDYGELDGFAPAQLLQDAIVLTAHRWSETTLREMFSARWAQIHWAGPDDRDIMNNSIEGPWFTCVMRSEWMGEFLRSRVEGDLDQHTDEPEDLPWEVDNQLPNSTRHFGLEFEWLPNGYTLEHYGNVVREALLPFHDDRVIVTGYSHSDGSMWHIKTDSSCGFELASPALTWREWPKVEAILRALYAAGARIDDRCGFHVHHEANDLRAPGLRRLLLLWMAYERVLTSSVKNDRRDNRYCQSFAHQIGNWQAFKAALTPLSNMERIIRELGRYQALNATGWWQHGRIEIRLHHGTLHPMACRFWVLLTQQMVEFAKVTRSYNEMEQAFSAQFDTQVEDFKRAVIFHAGNQEVLQLPKGLDAAIQRRSLVTQ